MYKIMIADDESIVIEALKFIIEKNFDEQIEIKTAKTGRSVIELAEEFRPDIAFMDIQMPGINGIDAIAEIRKNNKKTIFIVVSAFMKFDYAKEALELGVSEYINKPIQKDKIIDVLKKSIDQIEIDRNKRSNDLMVKEKLEIVNPLIESNFIYSMLFQKNYSDDINMYKELIGIEKDYGFIVVFEWGESIKNNKFTNVLGTSVKMQSYYSDIVNVMKEFLSGNHISMTDNELDKINYNFLLEANCIVGSIMGNSIISCVFCDKISNEYSNRVEIIETSRKLIRTLRRDYDMEFRCSIGEVMPISEIASSYNEAMKAFSYATSRVTHVKDIPILCDFEKDYPMEIEKSMFNAVEHGEVTNSIIKAEQFFDWLKNRGMSEIMDIKLKVLEMVLYAERLLYSNGGKKYKFKSRSDYFEKVYSMNELDELNRWFVNKIKDATTEINSKLSETSQNTMEIAKKYIRENYNKDISLDDVSQEVNISPYYFSKIFKKEIGKNFKDYLTELRIERAKDMLVRTNASMKEISLSVGYANSNYFSRSFKKNVGVTPTEYKENTMKG